MRVEGIAAASSTTFRLPLSARLLALVATVLIGAASLPMFGFLVAVLIIDQWLLGSAIAICTAVMVLMTRYVARDLRGKWGLRVIFGGEGFELFLPKNRSLIHTTNSQRVALPYADIAAIETRLEAYPSFGMVNMQRPYVLCCKNGDTIFLFEERAIGTGLHTPYFGRLIEEIAARAGVGIDNLGMSEGRGGILGVVHTKAANWSAAALPATRQLALLRRAASTGALALLIINLGFMARWAIAYLK